MRVDIKKLCVTEGTPMRDVISCIDRNEKGIAIVWDSKKRLVATITDGDIRRAILNKLDLEMPVKRFLSGRPAGFPRPVTANEHAPDAELLSLMNQKHLRHIPLLDKEGRLVDLAVMSGLVKEYGLPMKAVVMAGGFGTRLRPYTEKTPKPMLRVGDKPLLERIISQLKDAGVTRINVATHYRAEVISKYFGNGKRFGVQIEYVQEKKPLGTAGALGGLKGTHEPVLVLNGDILTNIDFRAMLDFHKDLKADMTVGVRQYKFNVPYGVVETDGVDVVRISEKPVMAHFINAGVYLMDPGVFSFVPKNEQYQMPDLISRLLKEKKKVVSFPVREYWMDIGQVDDYLKANSDAKKREV